MDAQTCAYHGFDYEKETLNVSGIVTTARLRHVYVTVPSVREFDLNIAGQVDYATPILAPLIGSALSNPLAFACAGETWNWEPERYNLIARDNGCDLAWCAYVRVRLFSLSDRDVSYNGGNLTHDLLREGNRLSSDFRCFYLSHLWLANKEDVKVVQELLRHAKPTLTLSLYAQAFSESAREAQGKIVEMVRNAALPEPLQAQEASV